MRPFHQRVRDVSRGTVVMIVLAVGVPLLAAERAAPTEHWSLAPLEDAAVPPSGEWGCNAIDPFMLRHLQEAKVAPSPEADRATLIRRLYIDLLGLPPTPRQVRDFIQDESKDAYSRLVEQLLASPHFGERWGRHWLDLARYGDTDGYEVDGARPNAWYYRDWVIDAVNRDLPFDRFTIEQLAGDLLPQATDAQRIATGFHRQTLTNNEGGIDREEYRVYAVMDRVSTSGTVWLGLTVGCAQCHDHPTDPITQRDYYGLFAIFNNADEADLRLDDPTTAAAFEKYQERKARHAAQVKALHEQIPAAETDEQRDKLKQDLAELQKKVPPDPRPAIAVMAERSQPRQTFLLDRGDFLTPREDQPIAPAVLSALPPLQSRSEDVSPNRLDLARWLVGPASPTTARVAVNHIWLHLFGEGLVRTPEDFGVTGEPPTHPQLLDFLAAEFIRSGWSRKQVIRLIVHSATYRQASHHRTDLVAVDPANRLLHHQNRFRVDSEVVRDLYMATSGLFASRIGGPSVYPPIPGDLMKIDFRSDLKWPVSSGADRYRRGMYTFFKRTLPDPNLMMFDAPDGCMTATARRISNTPLQALAMLNNEVFVEATQTLAVRLLATDCDDDDARLEHAVQLCLWRPATQVELRSLRKLLAESRRYYAQQPADAAAAAGESRPTDASDVEAAAWTAVASALMNLDAFVTRE